MNPFPLLALVLLAIPLIEIYVMIRIGSVIGAGWTVLSIVATAVIGAFIIRMQGFGVYRRMNRSMAAGELPAMELLEGLALLIAGLLLLTPGFITDALGFLLLVPPLRRNIVLGLLKKHFIQPVGPDRAPGRAGGQPPIEGEYRRLDD